MISRRMNQCVFWTMMFVCGVCAVQLGAQPPQEPACGNSCQLITYFQHYGTFQTPIFGFGEGGCLRLWVDTPNTEDPQGEIESKTAHEREDPTCASHCPTDDLTTGDVVMTCTYAGTLGSAFVSKNCYVSSGSVTAECIQQ